MPTTTTTTADAAALAAFAKFAAAAAVIINNKKDKVHDREDWKSLDHALAVCHKTSDSCTMEMQENLGVARRVMLDAISTAPWGG